MEAYRWLFSRLLPVKCSSRQIGPVSPPIFFKSASTCLVAELTDSNSISNSNLETIYDAKLITPKMKMSIEKEHSLGS